MSTYYYVQGVQVADEDWQKKKSAWNACKEAGIDIPKPIGEFFGWTDPNTSAGRVMNLDDITKKETGDGVEYFVVDIKDIPKECSQIRFAISY